MKRPRHFWTTAELARLRLEYPTSTHQQLLASFLRHTRWSIAGAAQRLKLKKEGRQLGPRGGRKRWMSVADAHVYRTGYFG